MRKEEKPICDANSCRPMASGWSQWKKLKFKLSNYFLTRRLHSTHSPHNKHIIKRLLSAKSNVWVSNHIGPLFDLITAGKTRNKNQSSSNENCERDNLACSQFPFDFPFHSKFPFIREGFAVFRFNWEMQANANCCSQVHFPFQAPKKNFPYNNLISCWNNQVFSFVCLCVKRETHSMLIQPSLSDQFSRKIRKHSWPVV